jgi:hypothetical protein
VATVHGVAAKNGVKTWLTLEILRNIGGTSADPAATGKLSYKRIVQGSLSRFSTHRLKPLFHTKKLGITTVIIWFCWATIGMTLALFLKNQGGHADDQQGWDIHSSSESTDLVTSC